MKVYFDNAATTPIAPEVIDAMLPYLREHHGNPSSIHSMGRVTKSAIENARKSIAAHLNASAAEIFFTSGGTESNNLVLQRAVQCLGIEHIITSRIEHHCVLDTSEYLAKHNNVEVHFVDFDEKGRIKLDHLEQLLQSIHGKKLVALMHANNELGNLLDLKKAGEICHAHGALLHSDTVQSVCHYELDLQDIPVDFITASAHKFHGPKGIGFVYINSEVSLDPLLIGGGQERNMRAGTENIYHIVGMAKAMDMAYDNLEEERAHILGLKQYMAKQLQVNIPDVQFTGDWDGPCLYTVLSVSLPVHPKNSMMLLNLDVAGICASSGSACSSGVDVGSHVMQALKVDPKRAAIRFSFSKYNTEEEVDYVVSKLKQIYAIPAKV